LEPFLLTNDLLIGEYDITPGEQDDRVLVVFRGSVAAVEFLTIARRSLSQRLRLQLNFAVFDHDGKAAQKRHAEQPIDAIAKALAENYAGTAEADSPASLTLSRLASVAAVAPFAVCISTESVLSIRGLALPANAGDKATKLAPVSTTNLPSTPLIATLVIDTPFEPRGIRATPLAYTCAQLPSAASAAIRFRSDGVDRLSLSRAIYV
jgi:hypothetical protein